MKFHRKKTRQQHTEIDGINIENYDATSRINQASIHKAFFFQRENEFSTNAINDFIFLCRGNKNRNEHQQQPNKSVHSDFVIKFVIQL